MAAAARDIIVSGAGIAGLTAALAMARRGMDVRIFERAARLDEIGAGLQLSPNATRILERLGVIARLESAAVRPRAIVLKRARDLQVLAELPLGPGAEKRWGAPYLVTRRADLQRALLAAVAEAGNIELRVGAEVSRAELGGEKALVTVTTNGNAVVHETDLVLGSDGVQSSLRRAVGAPPSRLVGQMAWRATFPVSEGIGEGFAAPAARDTVTAFLDPLFHLVAYPVRGGAEINLVAFTDAIRSAEMSALTDTAPLHKAIRNTAARLRDLIWRAGAWSAWPIHVADAGTPWSRDRLVLIGDAAHAMTPFAAQGAAMAMEDAETLAVAVAQGGLGLAAALQAWEAARRPRIRQVARRGAFNHFTWRASGPVAVARDAALRLRSPERLAADLDWLYGWDAIVE